MQKRKSTPFNLVFQLAGLSKTLEISDIAKLKDESTRQFKSDTVQIIFDIVQSYLHKKYQIQAIRRKYVPIFVFKGGNFDNALDLPQRVKGEKSRTEEQEGVNGLG